MKRLPVFLFLFLSSITVSQGLFYYLGMPDPMAAHFGVSGRADNFMPKNLFFLLEATMLLLTFGIFIVMPWAFEKFRLQKMNLPNRDHWLAPERIDQVYDYFRESFGWFGVASLILLIGVIQLVFEANINPNMVLNNRILLILLSGYFIFVIIWLIAFLRKFKRI